MGKGQVKARYVHLTTGSSDRETLALSAARLSSSPQKMSTKCEAPNAKLCPVETSQLHNLLLTHSDWQGGRTYSLGCTNCKRDAHTLSRPASSCCTCKSRTPICSTCPPRCHLRQELPSPPLPLSPGQGERVLSNPGRPVRTSHSLLAVQPSTILVARSSAATILPR